MKPVSVQVITYAPTIFAHCQHCELAFSEMGIGERLRQREAAEALPDDLREEYQVVSDWVHRLIDRHGSRIRVDVLDAASIRGFAASLRHRPSLSTAARPGPALTSMLRMPRSTGGSGRQTAGRSYRALPDWRCP